MIRKTDKRAGSRYIYPWVLFNLIIIIVGLVLTVWMFYSVVIDIRFEQSETLSNKLVMGIIEDGYLIGEVTIENILDLAELDKGKFTDNGNFYFNISIGQESFSNGNKS